MHAIPVNVVLDYEGHVAETKIYQISENYEVVGLDFYSVAIVSLKGAVAHFEIFHLEVVGKNFASLGTVNKIIFLGDVGISDLILEKHGVVVAIETFPFYVVFNVPYNDAIFRWTLLNDDADDAIVTSGPNLLNGCSNLFQRYVNFHFLDFFGE